MNFIYFFFWTRVKILLYCTKKPETCHGAFIAPNVHLILDRLNTLCYPTRTKNEKDKKMLVHLYRTISSCVFLPGPRFTLYKFICIILLFHLFIPYVSGANSLDFFFLHDFFLGPCCCIFCIYLYVLVIVHYLNINKRRRKKRDIDPIVHSDMDDKLPTWLLSK